MRKVLKEGFDRRYVLVPMLAAAVLVVCAYVVAESRRNYTYQLSERVRDGQDRMREIAELIDACLEAESAQRGFLLTGEPQYAAPYDSAATQAKQLRAALIQRYSGRDSQELYTLFDVGTRLDVKFAEMDQSMGMLRAGQNRTALQLVKTDIGLHQMQGISADLEALRDRERQRVYDGINTWEGEITTSRVINAASTVFTLLLLIATGLLATREIRRRNNATAELEAEVAVRTARLRELSEHMLHVSEVEKSRLARELHDELGGLLVAMRMDLSQLKRRITLPDKACEERWERIDAGLRAGVELKRRVIEELRPTLLDNMGLIAALRWQAEQSCRQGNIQLVAHMPEDEPRMSDEAAIAVFRTVQEALANVLKHAQATEVRIDMRIENDAMVITLRDNGVGIPGDALSRTGSHGMKQMRFRMQAVDGSCETLSAEPRGTLTVVRCPLVRSHSGGFARFARSY